METENFNVGEALLELEAESESDGANKKKKKQDETQAERLLKLTSSLQLFHDQHNDGYAFIDKESFSLRSKRVKQWLAKRLYDTEKKAPNSDSLNQAITVLEAKAIYDNPQKTLFCVTFARC